MRRDGFYRDNRQKLELLHRLPYAEPLSRLKKLFKRLVHSLHVHHKLDAAAERSGRSTSLTLKSTPLRRRSNMKLKHHQQKLLRKVDFLSWKSDNTLREASVMRRYHVTGREDYVKYSRLVGQVTSFVARLKALKPDSEQRADLSGQLLRKLYAMGLIDSDASLAKAEKVTVSCICRRRLPVILVRLKMAPTVKEATRFVEAGDVRVGPRVITDGAFLVTRSMEDFVTWAGDAAQKRHIAKYANKLDDFDLLQL